MHGGSAGPRASRAGSSVGLTGGLYARTTGRSLTRRRCSDLVARHRPEVLIISLGGNLRGYPDASVRTQVKGILDVAVPSLAAVFWISSPEREVDDADPTDLTRFTGVLRDAAGDAAIFIDSSQLSNDAGVDGVHFSGAEGLKEARKWAHGVFDEMMSKVVG